jgi:hypothetical protein
LLLGGEAISFYNVTVTTVTLFLFVVESLAGDHIHEQRSSAIGNDD